MLSINCKEIFEQYYQNKYDFNTSSLTLEEIEDIKKMTREKRVDYALAPIGTGIFDWILKQNNNIRFELVDFNSEKIDGMLYVPTTGKERAYIILNSNKPLINQIFTAAHEYYHYEMDYQKFKSNPFICDFNILKNVNEMRASRFAAELLLPEDALSREIKNYQKLMLHTSNKNMKFNDYATLSIFLTIKYQMPLKAVIYRLAEEHHIDNIDNYIENYDFMKKILQQIKIFEKQVKELYNKENKHLILYSSTYQDMEKAFILGNASKENILKDASKLNLDINLIKELLIETYDENDEDDDDELFSIINSKQR